MSRSLNKVTLIGNLGADPEVRSTSNGARVATLSVATSRRWKGQTGENQEKTEWHRIVLWGKQAESLQEYLVKGKQLYVEGKLQTREWEKDGIKRYTTEIIVDMQGTMQLLGGRPSGDFRCFQDAGLWAVALDQSRPGDHSKEHDRQAAVG